MKSTFSPAIAAFADAIGEGATFAQVSISRREAGFELRHVENVTSEAASLKSISVGELRSLAMETERGAFRPLHSAPNLRTGWICEAGNLDGLEAALGHLYPGGLTDWHARNDPEQVTNYRDFTDRQTGMYRITTHLDAETAEPVFAACCADRFCLKERRWTYDGLSSTPAAQLALPCLEPCALLLEFARKAVRISQEPSEAIPLTVSEINTLHVEPANTTADAAVREADFADDRNPRRRALLEYRLNATRDRLREQPEQ